MEILGKCFLFYISLFVNCALIAALPQGETETASIDVANALNVTTAAAASLDLNYDGRIVGGQVTSILNYPYQVSLQHHKSHICGGSILTHNVILTAAHCIEEPQEVASFQVRAGSTSHLYGGQVVGVQRIVKHPAYTLSELDSDVALVVLSENLTFTRSVRPIELPHSGEEVPAKVPLFVSGWGLTSETGTIAHNLNYVAVQLMDGHNCTESYKYVATITRRMFCAGLAQGGKDSCQGDSGGPLVSYVRSKQPSSSSSSPSPPLLVSWQSAVSSGLLAKPIQYGIVSFGVGCAQRGYPGVYTNVAALRPWIEANLQEITHLN